MEGKRPAWWKGKDEGVPLMPKIMPKIGSSGRHSFSGKEMEEMIWNRCHNTNWNGQDADLFVGGGNCTAQKRIQAWDHHKRLWQGSVRSQMSEFRVKPSHNAGGEDTTILWSTVEIQLPTLFY